MVSTYGQWHSKFNNRFIPQLSCEIGVTNGEGITFIADKYIVGVELHQFFSELCYELPYDEISITLDNSDGMFDANGNIAQTIISSKIIYCRFYFDETSYMKPLYFLNPAINVDGTSVIMKGKVNLDYSVSDIRYTLDTPSSLRWYHGRKLSDVIAYVKEIGACGNITCDTVSANILVSVPLRRCKSSEMLQQLIFNNALNVKPSRNAVINDACDLYPLDNTFGIYNTMPESIDAIITNNELIAKPKMIEGTKYSSISTQYISYSVVNTENLIASKTFAFDFADSRKVIDEAYMLYQSGSMLAYRLWIPFQDENVPPAYAYASVASISSSGANVCVRSIGYGVTGISPYGVYLIIDDYGDATVMPSGTITVNFYGTVTTTEVGSEWCVDDGEGAKASISFSNDYGMPSKTVLTNLTTKNDYIEFDAISDISIEAGDVVAVYASNLSYLCRLSDVRITYGCGIRVHGKGRVIRYDPPIALYAGDTTYLTNHSTYI